MDFNFPDSIVNLLGNIIEKESLLACLAFHAGRQKSPQGKSAEDEQQIELSPERDTEMT